MRAQVKRRRREDSLGVGTAAVLRVSRVLSESVRIAEVEPRPRCVVQLVRRQVVAQPVAAVVGEPELAEFLTPWANTSPPVPSSRTRMMVA